MNNTNPKRIQTRVLPEVLYDRERFYAQIAKECKLPPSAIETVVLESRSIDARQKTVYYQITASVHKKGERIPEADVPRLPEYPNVKHAEEVIVVGMGPAGLFAALELIERGYKPILIERGKNVQDRIEDIRNANLRNTIHPDSNYAFGEGGAGTYSDGKLYTRSKKRGNVRKVYEVLVGFGADPDILVDAHPHIGTNKLPKIIAKIRECILERGGEVLFATRVTDILWEGDAETGKAQIRGVLVQSVRKEETGPTSEKAYKISARHVILATGHSARDIFFLLHRKGLTLEPKPLAMGVRVEHSQELIDGIRYKRSPRGEFLPPASYSVVKQVQGRGVYSFCMCPGGVIAPCATAPNEIVTNGWSSSGRGRPTANSGIVVEFRLDDIPALEREIQSLGFDRIVRAENDSEDNGVWDEPDFPDALRFVRIQKRIENASWVTAERTQKAPAQRLMDFIEGRVSASLPKTSYPPGLTSVLLQSVLPSLVGEPLRQGFRDFEQSMPGFLTNEAVVHAPETRTSSPVRIPRDPSTCESPQVAGLYPCGEGAGYAGGIVSAAIDGMHVVQSMLAFAK